MLRSVIRHACRLRPLIGNRPLTSNISVERRIWSPMFIGFRSVATDQKTKDVESRVLRICGEYDKIQESNKKNLTLATHFMNDLGLDSLDHVEIIVALENEFGFEIPDADYDKLYTIQSVVDYLRKKLNIENKV